MGKSVIDMVSCPSLHGTVHPVGALQEEKGLSDPQGLPGKPHSDIKHKTIIKEEITVIPLRMGG